MNKYKYHGQVTITKSKEMTQVRFQTLSVALIQFQTSRLGQLYKTTLSFLRPASRSFVSYSCNQSINRNRDPEFHFAPSDPEAPGHLTSAS